MFPKCSYNDYRSGSKHFKFYQALNPDSTDRESVRMKIAKLELHQERGDKLLVADQKGSARSQPDSEEGERKAAVPRSQP